MLEFNDPIFLEQAKITANHLNNGLIVISAKNDKYDEVLFVNEYLADELGYTTEEFIRYSREREFAIVLDADIPRLKGTLKVAANGEKLSETYRLVSKDNRAVWYLAHFFAVRFNNRDCVAITHTNVEELIGTQQRLESDNQKWIDIINSIPIGIAIFLVNNEKNTTIAVNNRLVDLSNELGSLLDGKARSWNKEQLMMLLNQSIYAFCIDEDRHLVKKMLDESEVAGGSSCTFRLRGSTDRNSVYVFSSCFSRNITDEEKMYYVSFQNITTEEKQRIELKEKQELLFRLSYYDSLTGVKNRNAYNELSEKIKKERITNVGIAFCDLNGLKKTNDELGHIYGDRMLVTFVSILKQYVSENNIYRISGDEFIIIISDIEKADYSDLMSKIVTHVQQANNIASIGYIWKQSVSDMKRRINQAEQIMYVEKQKYYENEVTRASKYRPVLLDILIKDLENGRFKMYLQPKSKINEKRARGAEALIRKFDVNGNVIPPYEFIPLYEKERLIPKIDFYMLEEVCKLLEQMKAAGNEDFVISVNVSRVTLVENDYIEKVSEILEKYDINRSQLEFEITESNETMDHIRMEEYIKQIKSLGIGVSIDDAGTEYSSLPMFILEGIDWVKLDRSLVSKLGNEKARKLLAHMIIMSHDLNMRVIAEGVETDEERKVLESLNCDMYQGYYLSKPIPSEEFLEKYL